MFLSAIVMMKNRRSSEWELCWGAWGGGGEAAYGASLYCGGTEETGGGRG